MGEQRCSHKPEYQHDEVYLLTVFPKVVWNIILQKVLNFQDYIKISSSSSTFATLLLPRRVQILFPEVFRCLLYYKFRLDHGGENRKHDILNLRRVCCSWKAGVDFTLDNLPDHFLFTNGTSYTTHTHQISTHYRLQNTFVQRISSYENLSRFTEKFDITHHPRFDHPFVGRHIFIYVNTEATNFSGYLVGLLEILKRYGTYVWYLDIRTNDTEGANYKKICFWLSDVLTLTPNIQKLTLDLRDNIVHELEDDHELKMSALQHLRMIESGVYSIFLLTTLLHASANVEKLSLSFDKEKFLELVEFMKKSNIDLPRVSTVQTTVHCGLIRMVHEILALVKNSFGAIIKTIIVCTIGEHGPLDIGNAHRLNSELGMPRLKNFFIHAHYLPSLEFLLNFPLLEILSLDMSTDHRKRWSSQQNMARKHQAQETRRRLELWKIQNIWNVSPKLKLILHRFYVEDKFWDKCTQHQWELEEKQVANDGTSNEFEANK